MRSVVQKGSQGKDAFDAQRALNHFHITSLANGGSGLLGAPLREDSVFGAQSVIPLNDFKDSLGLPMDGVADDDTWTELEPSVPQDPPLPDALLTYGVPSAKILRGFSPGGHGGIDVSPTATGDGGVQDPRRGVPVYLVLKTTITRQELNEVRIYDGTVGLGFADGPDTVLSGATVIPQPWSSLDDDSYGGILGMAAHYQYDDGEGPQQFTLYVEYEHLITPEFPPKDQQGVVASLSDYGATGKGIGFGSFMVAGATLSAGDLGAVVLASFLGATQTPHVHLQARYKPGIWGYLGKDGLLLDPDVAVYRVFDLEVGHPTPNRATRRSTQWRYET